MSLQYARHLTAFERQGLHRIAKGRCGRRCPAGWKRERARALLLCDEGPEGEGWTDEAVAAAWDVSAGSVSRWRHQAVENGPAAALERQPKVPRFSRLDGAGEAQLLQRAQSPPAGQARWTLRALARARVARGIASRIRYETVRRVLKKRTDALAAGATLLSAGAAGGGLRDPEGRGAGPLPPALRCAALSGALQGRTAKSLRADQRPSQPARPGHPATYDYAYVRCGPCTLWMFVEPLGPWRTDHATAWRTAVDWAHQIKALVDHPRYREAERLIRVCDNLNTHTYVSFFRAFPTAEAERLIRRVRLVFTPRHGRGLHRA